MLRTRTWQGMDRVDSLSVAVFGALLTYAAVRAGTLLAPRLGDMSASTDAAVDALVLVAWAASVVVCVAGATTGAVLSGWGLRRVVRPLRPRSAPAQPVADAVVPAETS